MGRPTWHDGGKGAGGAGKGRRRRGQKEARVRP